MSQLLTLIWLKWKLLRNSLRSTKAIANQLASALGTLITLILATGVALGLGITAYLVTHSTEMAAVMQKSMAQQSHSGASAELIFFSIFSFLYLMWATLPLSIGGSKQFDAGRLLMYPISLRKLFAVDFISELTTLQSLFAVPAIIAISIGAGLGSGNLTGCLLAAIPTIVFGVALSKWLATTIGSLVRKKRASGETLLALIGAVAGLGGALVGQLGPILISHAESFRSLRWTPPGAAAFLMGGEGLKDPITSVISFVLLMGYGIALIVGTFWIARRSALGLGSSRKRSRSDAVLKSAPYTGWELPLISSELSAVVEKELRYAVRNAQLRMMALMPLIIIIIRYANSRRFRTGLEPGVSAAGSFKTYGSAIILTSGVLYVFLILAGISCNLFAFEEGGMRSFILSPIARRKILMGKNITVVLLALVFSVALLIVNAIVFRDLTIRNVLFATLSFVCFAASMSFIGNWFSIRFPKRMQYGKRLNVSGVAGLLIIPMIVILAIAPASSVIVGYVTHNLFYEYATLAGLAVALVAAYFLLIGIQGRSLERRELDILEAVKEPDQ
ncbi:MAG TPA: hypothetical protein VLB68_21130 [Pyrinomonadaceae bacterium]|nr:hypothetical protein [Pyrinomonadaceae bacterium]